MLPNRWFIIPALHFSFLAVAQFDRSAEHRSAQTKVPRLRSNAPRSTNRKLDHYPFFAGLLLESPV